LQNTIKTKIHYTQIRQCTTEYNADNTKIKMLIISQIQINWRAVFLGLGSDKGIPITGRSREISSGHCTVKIEFE